MKTRIHSFVMIISLLSGTAPLFAATATIDSGDFTIDNRYTLAISSSSGGAVSTPGEGSYLYTGGMSVSLTATPDPGYRVKSWTGTDNDSSFANTNAVTMDSDKTVSVEFEPITHLLTASVSGGHGTVSPNNATLNYGETSTLTATPIVGYRVKSWSGTDDDSAKSATNTVLMTSDKNIAVEFELIPPTVQSLSVALIDNIDPVSANNVVTYTVTYGNAGLPDATNTVITVILPEGLSFVSVSGGGVYSSGIITWNIGTLAGETTGQSVVFTARVKESFAEGGMITNSNLTIDCDETDPVTAPVETTTVNDTQAPVLTQLQPTAGAEGVPRETILQVRLTDLSGIDPNLVTIRIAGDLVYQGPDVNYDSSASSQSVRGLCTRTGSEESTTFTFKLKKGVRYDYEQHVDINVVASDKAAVPNTLTHTDLNSFITELRAFGANAKVNSDNGILAQDNPATAVDLTGAIWVVWDQATQAAGDTDIFVGKLGHGANAFNTSQVVYSGANTQSHPVIAVDSDGILYVAWQGSGANGHWDIFVSSSSDGTTWSTPVKISAGDTNNTSDQMRPSMCIHQEKIYIVYQDDRAGNFDIWVSTLTDGDPWMETQVTSDPSEQTYPMIGNTAVILWTDARNTSTGLGLDVYGAAWDDGWSNVVVVSGSGNAYSAVNRVNDVPDGMPHIVWVTDSGLFYGNVSAQDVPLDGTAITDEPNIVVNDPSLALHVTDNKTKLFVAWTDDRNLIYGDIADIYYAESGSPFGTNILINDDMGTSTQSKPAVGVDAGGHPYLVWVDERNGNKDIYYTGSTSVGDSLPTAVLRRNSANTGVVIGMDPGSVGYVAHLEVEVPDGAMPNGVDINDITIAEVANAPEMPVAGGIAVSMKYEFGPSGIAFSKPVLIRIPLTSDSVYSQYRVVRYDPFYFGSPYYPWTEEGISNPAVRIVAQDGAYVEVGVDHFSTFGVLGSSPVEESLLHDWNGDGIRSIIGDVPGFVNAVYFNQYPDGWTQEKRLCVGDGNSDGILSIIGDVPPFVDCVYFGNCPE